MSFALGRKSVRGWLFHKELKSTADFTDRLETSETRPNVVQSGRPKNDS